MTPTMEDQMEKITEHVIQIRVVSEDFFAPCRVGFYQIKMGVPFSGP